MLISIDVSFRGRGWILKKNGIWKTSMIADYIYIFLLKKNYCENLCSIFEYFIWMMKNTVTLRRSHCPFHLFRFFHEDATQEILDEFRPLLCPFDMLVIGGLQCLEMFLPTSLPPELHHKGFKYGSNNNVGLILDHMLMEETSEILRGIILRHNNFVLSECFWADPWW